MSTGVTAELGQFATVVNQLQAPLYEELAGSFDYDLDEVHFRKICLFAANRLVINLKQENVAAQVDVALTTGFVANGYRVQTLHGYAMSVDDPNVIADPTWQQFLKPEQRTPDMPRMIIGRRADVIEQIGNYGIGDPTVLRLWDPAHERF